ncbi:MAG: phosphoribosylformylglycinamidine cyclo-ligase [Candidatus Omnitrophota bacterium]|jgi:phosphoribosylformylglycinamidine cyclo-ligase|nr:MAG: phosphoribosylformylglycinamidine cyclo-ligase [Candidatus Omnitrophota bacterium]
MRRTKSINYKSAGVDIHKAESFKEKIKPLARKSFTGEVIKDIGGFGAFFRFPQKAYKNPVLVSSSDGVGTKLKIAALVNKHDTIGIDAVAMNVNDILCTGARPLFFLDYLAYSDLKEETLLDIIKGINNGCIESGCSLIGGETAQMPGMYDKGEYDVAGFCVGAIEEANIIDGSRIEEGDLALGLESSGLHSNGFSLVRKVFSEAELKRMSKELLEPTRIYVKPVIALLDKFGYDCKVIRGISHITGGAFYNKISRILPRKFDLRIDKNSWVVPKIFRLVQNKGNVSDRDMYSTLNMGIGMVLFIPKAALSQVKGELEKFSLKSWVIGKVTPGARQVHIN